MLSLQNNVPIIKKWAVSVSGAKSFKSCSLLLKILGKDLVMFIWLVGINGNEFRKAEQTKGF